MHSVRSLLPRLVFGGRSFTYDSHRISPPMTASPRSTKQILKIRISSADILERLNHFLALFSLKSN